ncbi:ABC transporter ATP-binding protein/permease [Desulfolutivibrio sulfoxidireducens]|uniref:ABC transporter ATP-binding protein/permease n=1 Tax=Desulfolutivibrio sulfoxidireducens TaxID=2773299 RepID=UPI00159D7EAB|nr:ABC transporter ATP-binding protein/permease [Desulfolutivibrio sulfoxidireducens]QLA17638.1 ATP-binding cassette domain-containing protein [Desulfolutivibrio sulfoxidireducens]QLA21210.1 ATP-binding cassette domain-containing protein [Desulfolutivibrio sulfoxidireducens]
MKFTSDIPDRITQRSLFSWVRTSNMKLQGILLVVIVVTVGARVLPLEMQKKIINQAIGLQKLDLLFMYCGYYLAAVVAASGLKLVINTLQTYIGQQSLADLRKKLYAHILTLPMPFFRTASPGMVVQSLVSEVANTGEFVGQAVAVPVTNLLTLLAFAAYLFYLNPLMAVISMALYPIAIVVIPFLQKRANAANKERVDTGRSLSTMIGETVSGIHEVHANASFNLENRRFSGFVDKLARVRVVWNLYKYGIKVSNNFFQSLGPFVLFLVGGYLAINGRFDLGALVAFLSANEKLYDPWKEMMDFYQVYQDAKVSYGRIMEYFEGVPDFPLEPEAPRPPLALDGTVAVRDLIMEVPGGIQLLKGVSLDVKHGEQVALVGFSGSGKSTLALCICQINKYSAGRATLSGYDIETTPKSDIADNLGVVSQHPFIFEGTIGANLLYSINARRAAHNVQGDDGLPSLDRIIEAIQQVGLFQDVLRFGLNTVFKKGRKENLVKKIVHIRECYYQDQGETLKDIVEFFDIDKYLYYSPVAANILFGNPNREEYQPEKLANNQVFLDFLQEAGLRQLLVQLGRELAARTVDILKNVPSPDVSFFEQSPVGADEFATYSSLVDRLQRVKLHEISPEEERLLLTLALRFTPGLHKIVGLSRLSEELLLQGRALFMDRIGKNAPDAVTFYRREDYIHAQTIMDNILFGRIRTDNPKSLDQINKSIVSLLIQEDMLERIVELGLEFQVGTSGDRLSGGQRQKVALARAFLKEPPLLILDEATAALDNASQTRIQNLLESKWKGRSTVISVVHRLDTIKGFDKVAVMKAGRIVECASYKELMEKKGMLYELVHGTSGR